MPNIDIIIFTYSYFNAVFRMDYDKERYFISDKNF